MHGPATCLFQEVSSVEETNGHFLLHGRAFKNFTKFFKSNHSIAVQVRLENRSLSNAQELVLTDILAHHHLQDGEKLLLRDAVVIVQVIELEGKPHLPLSGIEGVLLALLDGSKVGKDPHKLTKVDPVLL